MDKILNIMVVIACCAALYYCSWYDHHVMVTSIKKERENTRQATQQALMWERISADQSKNMDEMGIQFRSMIKAKSGKPCRDHN